MNISSIRTACIQEKMWQEASFSLSQQSCFSSASEVPCSLLIPGRFIPLFFCMVCKCVHHHFVNYHIPSLLCSCEVPPEVLHPVLRCRVQKGHVATGAGPEEGLKNGKRAGTPLLRRKVESAGVVQPVEEEAPGRPDCSLSILKGSL